jgi:hypothetical protein
MQAFGVYNASVINASLAHTELVANITVTTAAECQSLVRDRYPEANAAEYSNEGHAWCRAVFNACVSLSPLFVFVYVQRLCASLSTGPEWQIHQHLTRNDLFVRRRDIIAGLA